MRIDCSEAGAISYLRGFASTEPDRSAFGGVLFHDVDLTCVSVLRGDVASMGKRLGHEAVLHMSRGRVSTSYMP